MADQEISITRGYRTIEWLKTELVGGVSGLLRGMLKNSEEAILDNLANLVLSSYLLARRLGLGFTRLELKVESKIRQNIDEGHEVEKWYGDLSALLKHWEDNHKERSNAKAAGNQSPY